MPADFLTAEQKRRYGRYHGTPSDIQLERYFHLDNRDRRLIRRRHGAPNQLGFALQLVTVRFLGTFLPNPLAVPKPVIAHVAGQLGLRQWRDLPRYRDRPATGHAHTVEIGRRYGYHRFEAPSWQFRLMRWLYTRAWLYNERPSLLFDRATVWLVERKVLLPGASTLTRLIARVRERATRRLWQRLAALPTLEQRTALQALFHVADERRGSVLDRLRRGPTRISGPSLLLALERYTALRDIGLGQLDLTRLPFARIQALARYAATTWAPNIARMPAERRLATLVAFVVVQETTALDDAIDVLDLLITDIATEARVLGQKRRLRTLRDLDKAALQLREVGALVLDRSISDKRLRARILRRLSAPQLQAAIDTVDKLARPPDDKYYQELVERYQKVRRFLPALLNTVPFRAMPSGKPVLQALAFLVQIEGQRKPDMNAAPRAVITPAWKRLVINQDNTINRPAYTLCVLEQLQDNLRRRDIFVPGSDRWSDTRRKLLRGVAWQRQRQQVCRSLGQPTTATAALATLAEQLDTAYRQTAANFDSNADVRIDHDRGKPRLVISHLDELPDPPSLVALREQVAARLPRIDLPELLLEVNTWTNFTAAFTHISEGTARVDDFAISVCAGLMAEACNIGVEPVIQENVAALTRNRLGWVLQNFFRAETIIRSNGYLVDHHRGLELPTRWGGGEVASADGLRFTTPVKTIHSGPNPKYFGTGRGITYYNLMSDQYAGLHGLVIPGTLRDSVFILQTLLEQQSSLKPKEIMTDTAGSSSIIFALFWLLGYQFSPRLADIGRARFWRLDPHADYGALDPLARHRLDARRIEHHWDDMLRTAGSLLLGKVTASELIRTLLSTERPSGLALALRELGRIPKTLYLLNFVDDPHYRRRILTQLNRTENRHWLARTICHGQKGEIRKRYREGQEDQLGALGLVLNAVVLWNTVYIEAVLKQLAAEGYPVKPEDMARLSPLPHSHLNVLGRYAFLLAERVAKGQLRPLNRPDIKI